jgi:hypothetical protein
MTSRGIWRFRSLRIAMLELRRNPRSRSRFANADGLRKNYGWLRRCYPRRRSPLRVVGMRGSSQPLTIFSVTSVSSLRLLRTGVAQILNEQTRFATRAGRHRQVF